MKFNLNTEVEIVVSGEKGVVIGQGCYVSHSNQYLVRYVAGDGCAVEQWWDESALKQVWVSPKAAEAAT